MRIRIVGTGVMGRGIAQWAAAAGHEVELGDARPEAVGEAVAFVRRMLERAAEKGRTTPEEAAAATGRLHPLDDPAEPGPRTGLVVEAVREDLETKQDLLGRLQRVLPPTALLATNTSSLSVTAIAAGLPDPTRLAGLHFFNPVPLMKLVEVVAGADTRPDVPDTLAALVAATGHRAVRVADTPGFLVNHAGRGLITEALALLEEDVADHVAIDRIARDVLGLRMGPFELTDLTGLDVTAAVIDAIWRGFRHDPRLRPSSLTPGRVAAGLHGRKTGRGFYPYPDGATGSPVPADEPPAGRCPRPVAVAGGRAADREALLAALRAAGARVATAVPEADDGTLVLVPTWGGTVADAVADHGLPAARTFGVDPLTLPARRRVLALTPAADPAAARDARLLLAAPDDGGGPRYVTAVRDTPGGVAQRLLASIISVACSIAERRIAGPQDVDLAVTTGLGYPHGPLAWGDTVGAGSLLELQRGLLAATGDPRHRPTRWLTERARLGLPLTASGTGPADL